MIFGCIVIVGLGFIFKIETKYQTGIFFGLLSAFLAALFSVINSLFIREYNGKVISLWELIGGFVGVSIYLFVMPDWPELTVSYSDFGYLLILGVICTAFAYVVSVEVMKYLTPYTVNISINLEPVYGILLALLLFGASEKMSPNFYIGTLIIVLVIFINAVVKRRVTRKETAISDGLNHKLFNTLTKSFFFLRETSTSDPSLITT